MVEGNDPTPVLEDEGFTLEVVEEGTDNKDDATLALEAQIAELSSQLEQQRQAEPATPPTDGGMAELARVIAEMNKPKTPEEPAGQQVDFDALFKEVDQDFYKSPSQGFAKLLSPVLSNLKAETEKVTKAQEVQISKLTALNVDENKVLYGKYKDEVEEVASRLGAVPSVYQKALAEVKLNHVDDIIAERTQLALAEQVAAAEASAMQTATPPASAPTVTSAGVPRQAPPRKAQATPQEVALMKDFALRKGFDWKDPSDQEFLFNMLKKGGIR